MGRPLADAIGLVLVENGIIRILHQFPITVILNHHQRRYIGIFSKHYESTHHPYYRHIVSASLH